MADSQRFRTAKMRKEKDPRWGNPFAYGKEVAYSKSELLILDTLSEWEAAKHPRISKPETEFINSLDMSCCPFCGSAEIVRNGHRKDGTALFRCRSCGRSFNPLTGTVFDSRKIMISEWMEFLIHLFEFHSLVSSSRDNRNAENTGIYWLSKAFSVLEGTQEGTMLKGRIWLDETFVGVEKKKRVRKDGKKLRGISRNLIAIGTATDGESVFIVPEFVSKPNRKTTLNIFENHIAPGSTLVHDGDNSHSLLIERLSLKSEVHPTGETKGLEDISNPMDPINDIHSLFKLFMKTHSSYSREDLEGWTDLFAFICNEPENRYEKVDKFIRMAVSKRKIIRYRDLFAKKDQK